MNVQLLFGASVAFGLIAWGVFSALYLWPQLESRSRADALRPLLVLHGFRFIGLSFLIPGVVSSDLPMTFARDAAYGDLAAAVLALLALAALRSRLGVALAWVFNIWGTLDLLNAFYQAGASGLSPSQFGAAFFLPTFIVPILLITHGLAFRILLRAELDGLADRLVENPR
jgi:hypothetical protein